MPAKKSDTKLTKKQEAEIRQVYAIYWDSYLRGDWKKTASLLDDTMRMIGSTESEVYNNKKETTKFLKDTADQIAGNVELRNRRIEFLPSERHVMIIEHSDLFIRTGDGEWNFYSKVRLTSLLKTTRQGWRFIQQHGSVPDVRTQEGETIAFQQIAKENIELRDAVKRRTIELEEKNRELEIEASLERVRAVAMGMKEPGDMLDVCRIISDQLESLQVKDIRNVQTAIINEEKGTYLNYEYFTQYKRTSILEIETKLHPTVQEFANEIVKSRDAFFAKTFKGKALQEWREYRRKTNQDPDPILDAAPSVHYYFYSIGPGALGLSTYAPLKEGELNLFKRFRNVFELAYRRYMDIELAVAQAKEAQIETSLERIRAVAMSMNKASDLLNVCEELFKEFHSLGFKELRNAMINIHDNEKESFLNYDYSDVIGPSVTPLSYNIHPIIEKQFRQLRKASDAFSEAVYTGRELEEWKVFRKSRGEKDDPRIKNTQALYYYFYSIGTGSIGISTFSAIGQAQLEVLKRFRNVFNLSYKRYIDITMAEAQAREAKIEAALEKVRGKAMAMHNSGDISETMGVVFAELPKLGIRSLRCGVALFSKDSRRVVFYASADAVEGNSLPLVGTGEMVGHREFENQYEYWLKQENYFVTLSNDALRSYYEALAGRLSAPYTPREHHRQTEHGYYLPFSEGSFYAWSEEPYSEDKLDILNRFKSIIDLTFRRYLDLKRAEVQAREAQIESALERVRSRSLAMHHSSELSAVVETLLREFTNLEFTLTFCIINLINEQDKSNTVWAANPETGKDPESYYMKFEDYPFHHAMWDAWKAQKKRFIYTIEGEEKKIYDEYLFAKTEFRRFPKHVQEANKALKRYVAGLTFFKYSGLQTVSENHISEEDLDILERFGRVFEQSYTRFLDLQKAEAQAREAQIEASLERVRARAMAMHKTDELLDAAELVYKELSALGITSMNISYAFVDKEEKYGSYYSLNPVDGKIPPFPFVFPHTETDVMRAILSSWKKQEPFHVIELDENATVKHQTYVGEHILALITKNNIDIPFSVEAFLAVSPRKAVIYSFNFTQGYVFVIGGARLTMDQEEIVLRFTKVFEMTYRRFLDIQLAESQAREAQIEAALERVRSKTLAMQKSDELAETAATLFQQLIGLGIEPNRLYIAIINDENGATEFWITDEDGSKVSSGFIVNLPDNPSFQKMFDAWQEGRKSLTIDMQGKELEEYFRHLGSLNVPFKGGLSQRRRVQNIAFFSRGFIGIASPDEQPEETTMLLERFAAVFNLTLTRFNDLKLAEAQAHQAHLDLIQLQAAKKKAEDALSELSAAQAQLVQQEKLASLGQLTAGIAHEIKNPLNFVNNFSSVSMELVDEVTEELKKAAPHLGGDVPHLLGDIKANLSKIVEHGTRADGIVKSMLQHSRGASSKLEPTNINSLIKEYVNLAFHGMRASKTPINVVIDLDFDNNIHTVPLKAEDFSRVIVNICQNAFDAMREKLNSGQKTYVPKLSVRTRGGKNHVAVEIEDNGPGIPDAIKDKVLQPFFTTKKGTQGTGLGLSITSDIVRAHGGELKIESNENQGATFAIILPITS